MALLKSKHQQPIGVAFFLPPAWRQGYYWRPGMGSAEFFDHPKQLANDTVWFTNAHFDVTKSYGVYIKNYRFFRVPMHRLIHELDVANLTYEEQITEIGPFFARLAESMEADHLYHAESLASAMQQTLPVRSMPVPELTWQQLGMEARSWYWKGSVKHKLLMGGSLYTPRFDTATMLIKCGVPDFSLPPRVIKGEFKGPMLAAVLKEQVGFVRISVQNPSNEVIEFIDLSRTLWTSYEVLWLMQHADVTAKVLYMTPAIKHPADDKDSLSRNFKPFSWLDGLRLEALALAPGYKNVPMDAFLRGTAHTGMAHHAWSLVRKGLAPIALSYGKLGIAFNRQEESTIRKLARDNGLLFVPAEEEGTDLQIGKGL
jgi:hypothetical protein